MPRVCAALCAVLAAAQAAQAGPRHVLLLYSYEREFAHYTFAGLFRPELSRSSPEPIDFVEITLQAARTSQRDPDESTIEAVRSALGSRPLDLVVPIGGPAATFVQKHRNDLFPATPTLLTAVDSRFVETRALSGNETAVMVRHEPERAVESILRVLPETKTLVVVIGASRLEQFWLEEVKRAFERFEGQLTFVWTNDLTLNQLLERSRTLPPNSAIFFGIFSLDAAGVPQIETETLDALHTASNAPVFGLHSSQLGHGIVGGPLLSIEDLSRESAATAVRLLRGEPARSIPARTLGPAAPVFDARELRRWGIPERLLERGSIVQFREATNAQGYKGATVVAVSVAAAQTLIVIALALNMARRRTVPPDMAELKSAEAALSALSHRLMQSRERDGATMARAISDDVCQQLAELTLRLHALGVEAEGRAGPLRWRIEELCAQFWTVERELLAISDPTYHRLTLLGLADSARTFCERRCAEAGVRLEFEASVIPDKPSESIALALFRVMEQALDNALGHGKPSHVNVSLTAAGATIYLTVSDDGAGFDAEAALKRGSLGLIGMRERMRLVGGTWRIQSRPGAGTWVDASVPVA